MNSRDRILQALRANRRPFQDVASRPDTYLPVTRIDDGASHNDLIERFAAEAKRRDTEVVVAPDTEAAIQTVLDIIGDDQRCHACFAFPSILLYTDKMESFILSGTPRL